MGTMHAGGSAVVDASAAPPSSAAAVVCLPAADKKMTHHQQQQAPPASSDDNDSSNTSTTTDSRRRLEGKVAIVTGGAGGVGEAIARLFVAHGARVVIADAADEAAGQAVASSLGPPERCGYERCDVSVEADVERAVRRAVARHGRLDVLCNAAGVAAVLAERQARGSSSILTLDAAEFQRVVRANALGAALGIKHAARAMVAAGEGEGGGSIVSVGSVAGGMGPHACTASKDALVGLTKNAANELGRHGIRVNCVSPSGVAVATPSMLLHAWRGTDQEDGLGGAAAGSEAAAAAAADDEQEEQEAVKLQVQGATLRASDIAEAALFLASDESRYVSGHNLVVDGGVTTARNLIGL